MESTRKREIDEALRLLDTSAALPKQRTAVRGPYELPATLRDNVEKTEFSAAALQAIADHISAFLGTLNGVEVKAGVESSEHMLIVPSALDAADRVGLYTVSGHLRRTITITKKLRFGIGHVVAILAHESAHNYLGQWHLQREDEAANEILTDTAAAYLGLGGLLLLGYQPITWTTADPRRPIGGAYVTHTLRIGYLGTHELVYAVVESAVLRGIAELASVLSFSEQRIVASRLRKLQKQEDRAGSRIAKLLTDFDTAGASLAALTERLSQISVESIRQRIPPKIGCEMVHMMNAVCSGQLAAEVHDARIEASALRDPKARSPEKLHELAGRTRQILRTLKRWRKLVRKNIQTPEEQASTHRA